MKYFTTFDGLRLAYRDQGTGPPVLCLPGLTRDGCDFDYLAPHLSANRLIRPDYRGRGGSQWAQDFNTYAIPVEAQDVLALLDHLGIEQAAIIGASRGGLIAMLLAATAKNRLGGVCLVDIGPQLEQSGLGRIMDYLGRDPAFSNRAEMAAAMPALMPGFHNVPTDRWRSEVKNHTRITRQGLAITYDPRLRQAIAAVWDQPTPDLWPLFEALSGLPLALIRGANSDILAVETADRMRAIRPDMIFANVPDRAHIPFLDEPAALTAVHDWIKACP